MFRPFTRIEIPRTGPGPQPHLEPEPGLEPELDPEVEPELKPGVDPELKLGIEPELDPEPEPDPSRSPARRCDTSASPQIHRRDSKASRTVCPCTSSSPDPARARKRPRNLIRNALASERSPVGQYGRYNFKPSWASFSGVGRPSASQPRAW